MKQNGRRHTYSHYYYNGRNGMHEISMLCNDASEEKSEFMSNMSFITHIFNIHGFTVNDYSFVS